MFSSFAEDSLQQPHLEQDDEHTAAEMSILQVHGGGAAGSLSPRKKKRPLNHTFKLFGKGGGSDAGNENRPPVNANLYDLSQQGFSQFSQSQFSQQSQSSFVCNWLGQMTVHDDVPLADLSSDCFRIKSANVNSNAPGKPCQREEVVDQSAQINARQPSSQAITLPKPTQNPYLPSTNDDSRQKLPPQQMWISAFKPWPRYSWDFEHLGVLGEGVASIVYCAKKRVDGVVYAVKKLKRQIQNDAEMALLLKEVFALAAFADAPSILRYYSSWVEDGYLYVQTELCELGSLELLVGASTNLEEQGMEVEEGSADEKPPFSAPFSQIAPALSQIDASVSQVQESLEGASHLQLPNQQHAQAPLTIPEEVVWIVLDTIGRSLVYLHVREVAHLDVRPANIFVKAKDARIRYDDSDSRCQEAAYSRSLLMNQANDTSPSPSSLADRLLDGFCELKLGDLGNLAHLSSSNFNEGETRYCPREIINGESTDLRKGDVFSLGATCYELCLGRRLGGGDGDGGGGEDALEWHSLRDGILHPSVTQLYSPDLVQLLRLMMHPNPAERPLTDRIVEVSSAMMVTRAEMGSKEDEIKSLREENARLRNYISSQGRGER